jgi:integrase
VTLIRGTNRIYRGLFRREGMKPLHLSLRTKFKAEAEARHEAVQKVVRQRRDEMVAQLRAGVLTVERLEAMVEHHEPLAPIVVDAGGVEPWGTVDEAAERYAEWYETHPNRQDATRRVAGFQLQRFRNFEIDGQRVGDRRLDGVTAAMVAAYQGSMKSDPVNTVTTYMARVGAFYRWAAAEEAREARERNRPARPLHSPVEADRTVRETHRRDRVLTVSEANAVMARTPAPYLFGVACGLLAGLRIGETLHLRPVLDVELGVINIRKQPDWRPKTKRAIRLVPMAEPLRAIARVHVRDFASETWMFPSPVYDGEPLQELAFRKHFIQIVEGAGLIYGRENPQGVVYHTLRHSFASHAVMRGVDLYTVAKLLGDSLKVVEDVYADLSPDHKRAAVAKLASAFSVTASDTGNSE